MSNKTKKALLLSKLKCLFKKIADYLFEKEGINNITSHSYNYLIYVI